MDRTFEIGTHFGLTIRQAEEAGWTALAVECAPCGTTTHIGIWRLRQTSKYGFFQEVVVRMRCHNCGAEPSGAYMVREVKRPDALKGLSHRVEEWSAGGVRFQQMRAACSSVVTAHAAFDAELEQTPRMTLLLRQGAYVIRSTIPDPPPDNVCPLNLSSIEQTEHAPRLVRQRRAR